MTRYTPDSFNSRVREWFSDMDEASDWHNFPQRTPEEVAARYIGDAERAACTLLIRADANHPLLHQWVEQVATNTAYAAYFWDYTRRLPQQEVNGYGYRDGLLTFPTGEDAPSRWTNRRDEAILTLATAVIDHRLRGEDGIDSTSSVGGVAVTSSLAAALVEYHQETLNIAYAKLQRLRMGQSL